MTAPAVEVLYTSSAILLRLMSLFGDPAKDDRRVALVAYVGDGARAFLASPKDLRVICNPSAGGTSARVLRALIQAGAQVQLSRKLHSKVYWSKMRGCIIGSANASKSALGIGGLKETAVFLPPGMVGIDKLIDYAAPKDATKKALARLQRETRALPKKLILRPDSDSGKPGDFSAWFNSPHPDSDSWKLGWWMVPSESAKSAKAIAKTEYGVPEPDTYINVARGTVKQHDWLLSFKVDGEQLKEMRWLFVHYVVPVSPLDKKVYEKDYPYQAVQVHALDKCPSPPFKITPAFRTAFSRAVREWGLEQLRTRHALLPTDSLLKKTDLLIRQQKRKNRAV